MPCPARDTVRKAIDVLVAEGLSSEFRVEARSSASSGAWDRSGQVSVAVSVVF